MSEQVKDLLLEVQKADDEYAQNRASGAEFNIFDLFYADHKETDICNIIRELLSPGGSHGQGDIFLQKFFAIVLGNMPFPSGEIKVISELTIYGDRRIDLVIRADSTFIPIEVKIYAPDQPRQCHDYWQEIEKNCPNSQNQFIWYLTLNGTMPSDISLSGLNPSCVKTISFKKDIRDWLKECLAETKRRNIPQVGIILHQFLTAVQKWTGQTNVKYGKLRAILEKDVSKLLLSNRIIKNNGVTDEDLPPNADKQELSAHLKEAVDDLKRSLPWRILAKFDEKMDAAFMKKHGLSKSSANPRCQEAVMCDSYNDSKKMQYFFDYNESFVMANRIFTQRTLDEGHDLCFCFGLGTGLFAQIFIFNYANSRFESLNKNYLDKVGLLGKIESMLAQPADWDRHHNLKGSWINLPLAAKSSLKKCEEYDEKILRLFDDAVLEQRVDKCIEEAEEKLLRPFFK